MEQLNFVKNTDVNLCSMLGIHFEWKLDLHFTKI